MQNLSPIGWALRPLKNYTKFSGRASRAEFWWFFLFVMLTYLLAAFVLGIGVGGLAAANRGAATGVLPAFGIMFAFIGLFWLALLIPVLAVQVRRLHDTDRSGWWLGAYYLLYVVYFVVVIRRAIFVTAATGSPPTLGSSAVSAIIGMLFFIYAITLLVFFCLRGTEGPNRFGEDPYGDDVAEVFA